MSQGAAGRSALRSLLRALDRTVTSISGNNQWRKAAVQQFRVGGGGEDEAAMRNGIQIATDYTRLILNVAHHRGLLAEYNIGIDVEERSKKMVAATARRVGFALPDKLPEYIEEPTTPAPAPSASAPSAAAGK